MRIKMVSSFNCMKLYKMERHLTETVDLMSSIAMKLSACALAIAMLNGCASKPQIAVDPRTIPNKVKYEHDVNECTAVAENYDLTEGTAKTAIVGAAAGGGAAAGVAAAVAGAIFWPAIPFIAGAALVVGTGSGGVVKVKEAEARETILSDCMTERGYKTYKATNSANSAPNPQASAANIAYKPDGSPLAFSDSTQQPSSTVNKKGIERPAKSNFAKLEDVNAIPNLSEDKKRIYKKFLNESSPRAFAISENGNVGWASRGEDPLARALYFCQIYAKDSCTLYAVDNDVVYKKLDPSTNNTEPKKASFVNASQNQSAGANLANTVSASQRIPYGTLNDIDAIPYIKTDGQQAYLKFIKAPYRRAFAISEDGHYGWSWGFQWPASAIDRAIKECEIKSKLRCQIYATDDDVVMFKQ